MDAKTQDLIEDLHTRLGAASAYFLTDPKHARKMLEQSLGTVRELGNVLRGKVECGRNIWLCGHTTGVDCASGQQHHEDFVTESEETAKAHVEKYNGSWTTAGWYRKLPLRLG